MDIHEVIKKLVGPIEPVGESHTDEKRLNNLKVMISLVGSLINDLHDVEYYKNRQEHSMKICGEHVSDFFDEINLLE